MAIKIDGIKIAGLGSDAKSAYEIAKENGYSGTEQMFNETLGSLDGVLIEDAELLTDADSAIQIGGHKVLINRYNSTTLNTPYTQGLTSYSSGTIITTTSSASYVTQLAIPNGPRRLYIRSVSNGNPLEWVEFYSTNNKPTAEDVGALPITCGEMTGQIKMRDISDPTQGTRFYAN